MIRPLFEHYGSVTECDVLGSYGFVVSKQLYCHCYGLMYSLLWHLLIILRCMHEFNLVLLQFWLFNESD